MQFGGSATCAALSHEPEEAEYSGTRPCTPFWAVDEVCYFTGARGSSTTRSRMLCRSEIHRLQLHSQSAQKRAMHISDITLCTSFTPQSLKGVVQTPATGPANTAACLPKPVTPAPPSPSSPRPMRLNPPVVGLLGRPRRPRALWCRRSAAGLQRSHAVRRLDLHTQPTVTTHAGLKSDERSARARKKELAPRTPHGEPCAMPSGKDVMRSAARMNRLKDECMSVGRSRLRCEATCAVPRMQPKAKS